MNAKEKEMLQRIAEKVSEAGWKKTDAGRTKAIDYNNWFDLFVRRRSLAEVTKNGELSENSPNPKLANPMFTRGSGVESNSAMGIPEVILTPPETLPRLSHFDEFDSLVTARVDRFSFVIAYDSEWFYLSGGKRCVLTWQFAVIVGDELIEFIFLRKRDDRDLTLELAIGRILDLLDFASVDLREVTQYACLDYLDEQSQRPGESFYSTLAEANEHSKYPYENGKMTRKAYDWKRAHKIKKAIPITLLCHAGKVDISAFGQSKDYNIDILRYCTEVQGGLVTLKSVMLHPLSLNPETATSGHPRKYSISLSVADTMCHAPAGNKKLENLGQAIGYHKIELPKETKEQMNILLVNDPCLYFEYASTDAVVTLLYAASMYGYNSAIPVTITSATAKVMKQSMMAYLECNTDEEFDKAYRGLQHVNHGKIPQSDRAGFIEMQSLDPISRNANIVQTDASEAFHGGYNSCSDIGYFPNVTTDFDLQNAYPTAMCLVPDVDWSNPIKYEIRNRELTMNDFLDSNDSVNPIPLMIAYVRFEFPSDVKYPTIPVNVDGVPIFPRTSKGLDGVYACGPELYLAVRLGAKVCVRDGYVLNPLLRRDGTISRSLRAAVLQLVLDRARAKKEYGKGSLEELILKIMVNSGYGKNAQNVVQKQSWSAYADNMEVLGSSAITNPVSAAMITSIVRAELLAAQNQCHTLGYVTCSVTTDGFISDVPEDVLKSLDLFGLRTVMEEARLFLTEGREPEIWEAKHKQDDLVNFTTRGNVSLRCVETNPFEEDGKMYAGVCAHNSAKSPFDSDTYEDRLWLMTQVLGRTGPVECSDKEWTGFKEMVKGAEFRVLPTTRHIRMDFDMKRKPVWDSIRDVPVVVEGVEYTFANFTTMPFEDVDEFRLYRKKKELIPVLRTRYDWESFREKVSRGDCPNKIRDLAWSILNSCIMGHRAKLWRIPMLDELSGQERCDWINAHNRSGKRFKESDWKNAGKSARHVNILPVEELREMLDELGAESYTFETKATE